MDKNKVYTSMETLSPLLLGILAKKMGISMTITGNSMYPMLTPDRDEVVLESLNGRMLKRGEIILYIRKDGRYVLHRIVHIHENRYDLCGDHQCFIEKNITSDQILAVVKQFKRNGTLHHTNEFGYCVYVRLWILLLPARCLLYKLLSKLWGEYPSS